LQRLLFFIIGVLLIRQFQIPGAWLIHELKHVATHHQDLKRARKLLIISHHIIE
jgi:hypothetical protein